MKTTKLSALLTILLSLFTVNVFAYDIAVENEDGVTIYYNYINDETELEVTGKTTNSGGYSGSVVIPDEVTYMNRTRKVTRIGKNAFYLSSGLTSVTIGNSVTSIGDYAFSKCIGLTAVTIGNSVTSIGSDAFVFCSWLTSVNIYDIAAWCKISFGDGSSNPLICAHHLFLNGSEIKDLVIPDSVTSIGGAAFASCDGLTSVTIGNSVTSIGAAAFAFCSGLTSITIPNSVTSIGNYAFRDCSGLTSVTIPNSVKNIGNGAFYDCSGLTSVTIGNSVRSIGKQAFLGCDILEVISKIEQPFVVSIDNYTFSENTFSSATLYIPLGTNYYYRLYNGWKNFINIKEINLKEYKLTYMVDGKEYKSSEIVYNSTIIPEAEPTKEGYTFSGWSEIPEKMPAHDVIVTGTFTINKYNLIYQLDGEEYKTIELEYNSTIDPEAEPTKEGYTFAGWSEIPERMPAHDVIVTGTFTINKYNLIYQVDGEEYKTIELEYNSTINTETEPTKEGYTFAGWFQENGDTIPNTMPAHDLTVVAKFVPNTYQLTYMIGEEVYKIVTYEYGADIIPEPQPEGDYVTFEWTDLPQTMPAHDVVVYAKFTTAVMDMSIKTHQDTQYYSLDGQQTTQPRRGVTIVCSKNGGAKKVVVK